MNVIKAYQELESRFGHVLLLRSIDDFITEDPQSYTYNRVPTTPADRRLRQVFTTTIALRNRIGSS